MAEPAIIFDHVWKKFRRGERHDSLRDLVPSFLRHTLSRSSEPELTEKEFWALQDVSFEVRPGEALGIIGPNGAGKSTTLKLLTRILKPSKGRCEVRGRVGALIEVAAGFHPDLTGRENVYLQGAIMGMSRADVTSRLDAIIDFAGVGQFVDTPVKRYSSGMNARLGFSIAAHCDPAVLLIDEVLSVGDMAFQRRCIDRLQTFVRSGTATVFVSHDLHAIERLCTSALYVQGTVRAAGSVTETLQAYLAAAKTTPVQGVHDVQITATQLAGDRPTGVAPGTPMVLSVTYVANADVSDISFGFFIYRSTDGLMAYGVNVNAGDLGIRAMVKGQSVTIDFRFVAHLTRGLYHVETSVLHNPAVRNILPHTTAANFSVAEDVTFRGVADVALKTSIAGSASGHASADPGRAVHIVTR